MTHPINHWAPRPDDVCRCDGDWLDEELLGEELEDEAFDDEPCPHCLGRVIHRPRPVWMEEEEDDC